MKKQHRYVAVILSMAALFLAGLLFLFLSPNWWPPNTIDWQVTVTHFRIGSIIMMSVGGAGLLMSLLLWLREWQ